MAFLVAAVTAGVLGGPAGLGAGDVFVAFVAKLPLLGVHSPLGETQSTIVFDLRLPRVVLGALVGATLAVAGGAYQGVFRNPLADPYLLGISAGAGLAATAVIAYGPAGASTRMLLPAAGVAGGGGGGAFSSP